MSFTPEQEQLRRTPVANSWGYIDLDHMIPKVIGDVQMAATRPSCVVLLLDDERAGGCSPEIAGLIQQRLSFLRHGVDVGGQDFALCNMPQYVIDRVMAHTIPEGWKPGQYNVGDLA